MQLSRRYNQSNRIGVASRRVSAGRTTTDYQLVADALRRKILGGGFEARSGLPTERELGKQFGASLIMIRRALQILAEELLVERCQGCGTFASLRPSRRIPLHNANFGRSVAAHAPDLRRVLDTSQWTTTSQETSGLLGTFPGGRVLFARRLDLLDGAAVAYDEIYLPELFADQLSDADLAEVKFLERWQHVQQIKLDHVTQTTEAVPARATHLRHLRVARGLPLLKETNVTMAKSGTPCGLFISHYRHDLFRLHATTRLSISSDEG